MSWHLDLVQIFDVVLRVPALFVMDSVLDQTFLFPWMPDDVPVFSSTNIIWGFIICVCFVGSIIIFLLPTQQILDAYSVLMSAFVLWFSYWFNQNYVLLDFGDVDKVTFDISVLLSSQNQQLAFNIAAQVGMAFSYNSFRLESAWRSRGRYVHNFMTHFRAATYLCLLQPVIWTLMSLPKEQLRWLPLLSVLLVAAELVATILVQLSSMLSWMRLCYLSARYMLRTYGVQTFLERQWVRLHVPNVLRVFWITRTAYHLTGLVAVRVTELSADSPSAGSEDVAQAPQVLTTVWALGLEEVVEMGRQVLVSGCATTVALLGMTSVVSYVAHYVGLLLASFVGSQNDEDRNMGTMSAILFFILALQTGLTSLDEEQRLVRLYRNFCLLATAVLHFAHTMVNPLLMTLSASRSGAWRRHARALTMCLLLILCPAWLLYVLWQRHTVSTWLLAVTAFSVEVIIKVVISLLVYLLFMTDAYRDVFWEQLDDYVYYIKSTGNTIEFTFGIFLFINGAWIMLFESGGAIRALMMVIHAYFNIWVQAKEGWRVLIKRRTAVKKINSLPLATDEELSTHNDVCAICYQELASARITSCRHLFHGVCLRKWLYVQDCCPLCHKLIYKPEQLEQTEEVGPGANGYGNVQQNGGNIQNLLAVPQEVNDNWVPLDDDVRLNNNQAVLHDHQD